MFLSKDPRDGYWYIYYETSKGKRHRCSTHTKLKFEASRAFHTFEPPPEYEDTIKSSVVTLSDFRTTFLEYASTRYRPNTVRGTFQMGFNELIRLVGDVEISKVDEMVIEKFLTMKLQASSRYAARHCYAGLASAFQTACRWKIISRNSWRQVKKPKVPEIHPVFLSEADFTKLLNVILDPCFNHLCVFAVLTGLRSSEIISLEWNAIDLDRRLIHVQNTATFVTKSMKNRVVPMNDTIFALLHGLNRREGRVFLKSDGRPWARDVVTRWFRYYADLAGLDKRVHFHTLRHTFASWLVQKGTNLYEIKEMLGHASISTTEIYAHLQPELLHTTVNRISLPLNGGKSEELPPVLLG